MEIPWEAFKSNLKLNITAKMKLYLQCVILWNTNIFLSFFPFIRLIIFIVIQIQKLATCIILYRHIHAQHSALHTHAHTFKLLTNSHWIFFMYFCNLILVQHSESSNVKCVYMTSRRLYEKKIVSIFREQNNIVFKIWFWKK